MFPALPAPPEEISNNFFNLGGAPPMYPMHMRPPMPPRGPPRMMFMRGPPPPGKYTLFVLVLHCIAWEHDTPESITRSAELWNRWIRLSCYYNRVYILCHRITINSYKCKCIGTYNLFYSFRSIFIYNSTLIDYKIIYTCLLLEIYQLTLKFIIKLTHQSMKNSANPA